LPLGPNVLTLSVAGAADVGFIEQVAPRGGDGCTEQLSTAVVTGFVPKYAVTVEVDEPPGFTELGVNGVAETWKTGGGGVKSDTGDT